MPGAHTPIMSRQMVEALAPRDGRTYVDGTFGAGGGTLLPPTHPK